MKTVPHLLLTLVFILGGFPSPGVAQFVREEWLQQYNGPGNGLDRANALAVDAQGNVIVTGMSFNTSGGGDYYTVKYSPAGAVLWSVRYNGPVNGNDEAHAVVVDKDGNVIVTGASEGPGSSFPTKDVYTAKYAAATGALMWQRRYAGSGDDEGFAVAVDQAGNVAVAGHAGNFNEDYFVARYTATGGVAFERAFTGGGSVDGGESFNAVAFDAAGNVVVTGSGPSTTAPSSFQEMVTQKYSPTGQLIWERRYNAGSTGNSDVATALVIDAAGDVVITGYSATPNNSDDFYTAKYAGATGALIWESKYNNGAGVSAFDRAQAVALDRQGNAAVTGRSGGQVYTVKYSAQNGSVLWERRSNNAIHGYSIVSDINDNVLVAGYSAIGSNVNYYVAEYHGSTGSIVWEKTYDGTGRSDYIEARRQLGLTPDGGVVVTGYSENESNRDYLTIKYARTFPTVETSAAKKITANSAEFSGSVRPNGLTTQVYFEYGASPSFGLVTTAQAVGSGTSPVAVTAAIDGLQAGTTYYFRLVAVSEGGTPVHGNTVSFVAVPDTTRPTVTLLGQGFVVLEAPATFVDPGATATDTNWGDLPVATSGAVNGNTPGNYTVTYSAVDGSGNTGSATRTVRIVDTTRPTITLLGAAEITLEAGVPFDDPGATASDTVAGVLTVEISGSVNHLLPGLYTLTYTADDGHGNTNSVSRTVRVVDTTAPVIGDTFTPLSISTGADGYATLPDYLSQALAQASDAVGAVRAEQQPAAGSKWPAGDDLNMVLRVFDAADNVGTKVVPIQVLDGTVPSVAAPVDGFSPVQTLADAQGFATAADYASQAVVSDNRSVASVVQDPPPGTPLRFGPNTITLTVRDIAGNEATIDFIVTVRLQTPVVEVVAAKGSTVPGAGSDPRVAADATFTAVGIPAVADDGQITFLARWKSQQGPGLGVFGGAPLQLLARDGDEAPGMAGARFKTFSDPLIAPDGTTAFQATVAGPGIRAPKNLGIWKTGSSGLRLALQRGTQLTGVPDRHILKSIGSMSLRAGGFIVSGQLALSGNIVTEASDTVLLRVTDEGATILAREGEDLDLADGYPPSRISQVAVLIPARGSVAQGRSHGDESAIASVILKNGRKVILGIAPDGSIVRSLAVGDGVENLPDAALLTDFALPGISTSGHQAVTSATLAAFQIPGLPPVVTPANDKVLLYSNSAAEPFLAFAREGQAAADSDGAVFSSFFDPVVNDRGEVAFAATLAGKGVTTANRTGLWWGPPGALKLLARSHGRAVGIQGEEITARWANFVSLALPGGESYGPVFVARLQGAGVTARNNQGVWAVDSEGMLRQILRTGDEIEGKRVTKIDALCNVPRALGASRGFNTQGTLSMRVGLAGNGQAVLRVHIPDGVE